MFTLGVHPTQLMPFNRQNIGKVPQESGVYIIYEAAGPFYVGRSGSNIRRRLLSHFNETGNINVKLARKIKEFAETLTFTYFLIPRENQKDVETILIPFLGGPQKLANLIHGGMFEKKLFD